MLKSDGRIELPVTHFVYGVLHHPDESRFHVVQSGIDLFPVSLADVDMSAAVVKRVRVPLCTVAYISRIGDAVSVYSDDSVRDFVRIMESVACA